MTTITADTSEAESQRVMFDRQAIELRTAMPCIVVAVSSNGTTVDVQPAISQTQRLDGNVNQVNLPIVRGVPIAVMGSTIAGLFVCIPISAGDDGLLIVCDRAIDNWQYGDGVSRTPDFETPRHHDITDAIFYPGAQRISSEIPSYPTNALELRNRAGTCKHSVSNDTITSIVPGGASMIMTGNTTAFTGNVTISQNLNIGGSTIGNGVNLNTHVHSGVQVGAGNTGGPV